MPSLSTASLRSIMRQPWWLMALLACVWMSGARAVDAELTWASLSGEQQYILVGYAQRWASLDLTTRRALVQRAEIQTIRNRLAPVKPATAAPADKSKAAAASPATRRRRSLSAVDASLSSHSVRLRRLLRELPGLSANERRALLERWGSLSSAERVLLVDRYMHNPDDDEEMALQQALRNGKISHAELQRGLASGKLSGSDVKDALTNGTLSIATLKKGVASRAIVAEDLERTLRAANIDSSELNNAIEHNRTPPGGAPRAGAASPAR